MYNIYFGDKCIYDDRSTDISGLILINPKLVVEDNSAGSLEFTVPPTHPYYSQVASGLRTVVNVFNDNDPEPVWTGRVLSVETDFWKRKTVFCEGALAWLSDTVGQDDTVRIYGALPLSDHQGNDLAKVFLNYALRGYNDFGWVESGETQSFDKVETRFQIKRGAVTVSIPNPVDLNGKCRPYKDSTEQTCLQKVMDLQETYGGHMQAKANANGNVYLNWYADFWQDKDRDEYLSGAKVALLGKNLLDLESAIDASDVFTVLYPIGESKDNPYRDSYADNTPEITYGHYIDKDGNFVSNADSNYGCSHSIKIDSEQEYYYTGIMTNDGTHGVYYAVLDENTRPLYVKSANLKKENNEYKSQKMTRERIVIPEDGRWLRLCWQKDTSDNPTNPKLEILSAYADGSYYVDLTGLAHSDSPLHSPYITVDALIQKYGWIEKKVTFENINHPEGLYQSAKRYIGNTVFVEQTFTVKYLDLGIAEKGSWQPPKLYDPIHVVSVAHGIDAYMYITKLSIPLNKPQDMVVTVGGSFSKSISRQVAESRRRSAQTKR